MTSADGYIEDENTLGHRLVLASVVGDRDGMALEPTEASGDGVAEVFKDDATGVRTVTFFSERPVPLDVVQWLAEAARLL